MNIFLDLGTHYGQGLREFMRRYLMDEAWNIYTFEANPITYGIYVNNYHNLTPWVKHHNKAVSDHDGLVMVNIETPPGEGETGMGSSIMGIDSWNPWGLSNPDKNHFKTTAEVPCIDISRFIQENFHQDDRIIVKMDIEGAEFQVLEKMITDKTILRVKEIWIEFHENFFNNPDPYRIRKAAILKYLSENRIVFHEWR